MPGRREIYENGRVKGLSPLFSVFSLSLPKGKVKLIGGVKVEKKTNSEILGAAGWFRWLERKL